MAGTQFHPHNQDGRPRKNLTGGNWSAGFTNVRHRRHLRRRGGWRRAAQGSAQDVGDHHPQVRGADMCQHFHLRKTHARHFNIAYGCRARRGPDWAGTHVVGNNAIAHERLSIIGAPIGCTFNLPTKNLRKKSIALKGLRFKLTGPADPESGAQPLFSEVKFSPTAALACTECTQLNTAATSDGVVERVRNESECAVRGSD